MENHKMTLMSLEYQLKCYYDLLKLYPHLGHLNQVNAFLPYQLPLLIPTATSFLGKGCFDQAQLPSFLNHTLLKNKLLLNKNIKEGGIGSRRCKYKGCTRYSQGGTQKCVAHGGGKRCNFNGCKSGARGNTKYCIKHGGGKRCTKTDCDKSAVGKTNLCVNHGGGKRCREEGCSKSAQGSTNYCVTHGRDRQCSEPTCTLQAQSRKKYCADHTSRKRARKE